MAEVRSKEIASFFEVYVISFNNLSFSHSASTSTGSFSISTQAFHNDFGISSHVAWGTECVFWDQLSSVVEDAWSWAFGRFFTNTFSQIFFSSFSIHLGWMAELFSEESWWALINFFPMAGRTIGASALIFLHMLYRAYKNISWKISIRFAISSWWALP